MTMPASARRFASASPPACWARGALRRRPQARSLPDRTFGRVRRVGAGLPRSGMRPRHAAGSDAAGARRARRAAAHRQDRRRSRPTGWSAYRAARVAALDAEDLSGYVLKKDSPSCGLERVKVYDRTASPASRGRGLFAAALVERVSATCRSRRKAGCPIRGCARTSSSACSPTGGCAACSRRAGPSAALVRFHTAHKLILMAHSPEAYRQLGRLVAGARGRAAAGRASGATPRRSWPR